MRRELRPEMIKFLDNKLADNGLFQHALGQKDARTIFRLAAQVCVGIREVGGNNRGPMVTLIQDTVGGPDHVAWCLSFVQTCIAYAELRTGKSSPVFGTEHCMTCWQETPVAQRVRKVPLAGAIAIWRHGSGPSGHTGIVESCDGDTFFAYEANTGSGMSDGEIVREGDGVYYTHRALDPVGNMQLMGFIRPF